MTSAGIAAPPGAGILTPADLRGAVRKALGGVRAGARVLAVIPDKTRDDKYPVDGGVFDVDSETGDVVVPIRATLAVNAPVMFAVTLEKPGGVVVSKRDRIVVTAKLPPG